MRTDGPLDRRRVILGGAATAASAVASPTVWAQGGSAGWPNGRTIRIIVPYPPGAANDAMGRLAAQKLEEKLGTAAVVENRPGGNAVIGTTAVLQAAPDGLTLLASAFNHIILNQVMRISFDPQADFEAIARTARAPLVMVMAPQRPERSIAEIVAAAKAHPQEWTFGVAARGAAGHLATIDFMRRTGVEIAQTSYRGTAPALTDVIGGHTQLLIDASFALLPTARDGKVRAIGLTTRERSPLAPEIPTLAEAGLPDFEFQSWYGLWAPKGTPREICERINAIMREMVADPEVVRRLQGSLLEPVSETIDEMKAFIAAEVPRQVALLRSVNFQPE